MVCSGFEPRTAGVGTIDDLEIKESKIYKIYTMGVVF